MKQEHEVTSPTTDPPPNANGSSRRTLRQRWYRLRTSSRFPFVLFGVLFVVGALFQVYWYWWGFRVQRVVHNTQGDVKRTSIFPAFVKNGLGTYLTPLEPVHFVVLRWQKRVEGAPETDDTIKREDLRTFRHCPFLRELGLTQLTPETRRELENFTQVRALYLDYVREEDAEAIIKLPRLETLYMSYFTPETFPYLVKMKGLRKLQFTYYGVSVRVPADSFHVMAESQTLKSLTTHLNDAELKSLTAPLSDGSPALPQLNELHLWGIKCTAVGLTCLKRLPALTSLELYGTDSGHILDDTLVDSLSELHQLESLQLKKTQISEQSLLKIAGLPRLRSLRVDERWYHLKEQLRQRLPAGCVLKFE